MNLSTNPSFTHGIDKLCTICHVILTGTDSRAHSIFSTLEELESPMNVLQVLQSFSNFNFYNGTQMICTTCHNKTIDVYKFIQMCNKAHENMQHYLKYLDTIKTIKDETDVDVKVEEISTAPTRILIDGQECVEETENEIISKFDELGMVISRTEIKIEETSNNEEITTRSEIVTVEKTDISDFDNLNVEIIDEQLHDERMGLDTSKDCRLVISDKKELRDLRNEAKRTKEKPSLGEMCNPSFGTKYMRSHDQRDNSQRAHISKDLTPNQDRHQLLKDHETDVVCLECEKVFNNDKQLKIHMRRSHKKNFLCNDCGKVFSSKSYLNKHIHVHTDEKTFTCTICNRGFAAPSSLRRHVDSHNGVKAHKCEQCDRRFTRVEYLRSHMDLHNGIKPHKCEQCDRRFTQAAHLRSHMNIHNGIKAHKCEQCDRRFTQTSALRSHMKCHNGVKAHKCEQCHRRFTRADGLRRHMIVHNTQRITIQV